jgi:hypothetical protein
MNFFGILSHLNKLDKSGHELCRTIFLVRAQLRIPIKSSFSGEDKPRHLIKNLASALPDHLQELADEQVRRRGGH